jgi:hypothetical protein
MGSFTCMVMKSLDKRHRPSLADKAGQQGREDFCTVLHEKGAVAEMLLHFVAAPCYFGEAYWGQ